MVLFSNNWYQSQKVYLASKLVGKKGSSLLGAMEEEDKFRVEKFICQNYQLWKMQMEDYMYLKDLFLPLGLKTKQPTTMKDE